METISAVVTPQRAILLKIPGASSAHLTPCQEDWDYWENARSFKWIGPFEILSINENRVFLDYDGREVQHLPYKSDHRYGRHWQAVYYWLDSNITSGHQQQSVLIDEVQSITDPRKKSPPSAEAWKKVLQGLVKRKSWKTIKKSSLLQRINTLNGRFVLSIMNINSGSEV